MEQKQPQPLTPPEVINPDLDIEFMEEVRKEYKEEMAYVEEAYKNIPEIIEKIGNDDLIPEKIKKMLLIMHGEFGTTHFANEKYKLKPYFKTNDISKEDYKDSVFDDLEFLKKFIQICLQFENKEYVTTCITIKKLAEFSLFNNFKKIYENMPSEYEIDELRALYIIMEKLKKDPNIEALKNTATKGGPNNRVAEEILKSIF